MQLSLPLNATLVAAAVASLLVIFKLTTPGKTTAEIGKKPEMSLMLLVSVASLYLELVLIRWIGTEVRIFAYIQNLVLITCFLGFGVGCFQSGKPGSLMPSLYSLALLALIVGTPLPEWQDFLRHLSNLLALSNSASLWGDAGVDYPAALYPLAAIALTGMLWLLASSMIPFGRWIGYCFDHSGNTVRAYSVNLAGSLLGTWLLLALSLLSLPPACWIALAFVLVLAATPKVRSNWIIGCALLLPVLIVVQGGNQLGAQWSGADKSWTIASGQGSQAGTIWSPYQKLLVQSNNKAEYFVMVNNVGYMTMANTTPEFLKKHPDVASGLRNSVYDSPFRFLPKGASVLVIGAGAGNDASAALRNGASHVTAVEIDPVIYKLGKQLHPDHPYDSDKVSVIINDARNFLRRTGERYDAVIFGLLDSHTEVSGYTNMRVDNYVYTKDSFEQARRLLKPDGLLILKFEVRDPWTWMGARFYRTLSEVFGHEPVTFFVGNVGNMWGGTVYLESNSNKLAALAAKPDLKAFIAGHPPQFPLSVAAAPEPSTDDWPYPYNRDRAIPSTYLVVSALLLLISFVMVRKTFVPHMAERETWTMFFLGAGFMLMETQLISRLTLYFGTTWIVNSIAISTVLAVLVMANLYLEKHRKAVDRRPFFAVLFASLFLNYFFPWEQLPFAPWVTGLLLSGAYAVSVFMAGIIFTSTLREAEKKSGALGANVIGAVAGGLSQNLSFIIGLKALLLLAAGSYIAAAFFSKAVRFPKFARAT